MTITARQLTVDVLHRSRSRDAFASELVDDALAAANLSAVDRRLVTQLVFGIMRRKGTLDVLLKPFIRLPFHAIEPRVWDVLQLGAFQLVFLTHIPPHAAVNETVELAAYIGSLKAKGFVNGVLRRVSELVTDQFTDAPSASAVPFEAKSYRRLARAILPDPTRSPDAYLSEAFSLPKWLSDRWLDRHGLEEATRLGFWFNAPPPLWIRINKTRANRENYRLDLAAKLVAVEPGEHPQSLHFIEHHAIRSLPGYDTGAFAVQDHSSMLVASALAPQPGMRILDLCAAPGGKTSHLLELMDNRGRVTACDIDEQRLETVTALCQRLGLKGLTTHVIPEFGEPPAGPFDAAMVDVPCSNTGVLGRRPEVRWRLKPNEFEYLVRLQTRLLFQAIDRVKPGGVIVYSTCSIEPDENENVIASVRRGMRGLKLEAEQHSIPGKPSDGGYWARLRKP